MLTISNYSFRNRLVDLARAFDDRRLYDAHEIRSVDVLVDYVFQNRNTELFIDALFKPFNFADDFVSGFQKYKDRRDLSTAYICAIFTAVSEDNFPDIRARALALPKVVISARNRDFPQSNYFLSTLSNVSRYTNDNQIIELLADETFNKMDQDFVDYITPILRIACDTKDPNIVRGVVTLIKQNDLESAVHLATLLDKRANILGFNNSDGSKLAMIYLQRKGIQLPEY